ncbi:integral membrane protein [Fusarium napiforme]|uniref:Integral membrane protein n=1 Tax=Fusarium napiforme TaxID=42672 RepID=A0A8H5JNF8_9HYPO|nr:integral membrane protein [Fusarium napiforme]
MSFPVVNGVEVAVAPPSGYTVDFENPLTDASMVRNAYWIFGLEFAIATAFLGQRMYTNAVILRKFLIDDYLILLAWVLSIAAQSCLLNAYSRKLLGVHAWEMPIDSNTQANLLVMCTTLTYIPTTILSKLTLCFFYYRLSPSLWYQYSVYFTGFLCSASLVGIWFSVLFACKPIAAGWDVRMSVGATCINRPPIYITQAAFGCITDVMLLVLPIPTVVGLQMSTRQKLGLVGLFAIGSITLITSIVRLVLLLPSLSNPDQSWSLAEGCLWVIIEANLLIMCGSLPTLRVFLKNVAPRVLGDRSTRKGSEEQSGSANFGLHTFGGSNGPRRKFDTLVELEHDTHFNRVSLRPEGLGKTDVNIYSGRSDESLENNPTGDNDSEDGILQTRTTTVKYTNIQSSQYITAQSSTNMSTTRIEIDPEGDTLIILPVKPASTQSETPDPPTEKHYLCSKKHLTLACRRAAKLFSSQFKEASVESDGLYHWKFEGIFDAEAFELVLKIIHGKTRDVPRSVKLDLLSDIATIVDDLECHEAVAFFSTNWLFGWTVEWLQPGQLRDKPLAQVILASFVFEHASLFQTYTKMAIRHNIDVISTYDLPIRADVSDKIETTRIEILQRLVDGLDNLQTKILADKVGCNEACRATLLGSLLQGMKKSGVYPRPSSPFPKLSLDDVLASLANVQSPAYFGPQSQAPLLNYAGRWNLDPTSANLVSGGLIGYPSGLVQGQPKPATAGTNTLSVSASQQTTTAGALSRPSGSLFGSSSTPQNTNTQSSFNFGRPSPSSGSLFGTPTVSHTVKSPHVASQSGTKGLSGSSAGTTSSTTENPEQPGTIVRHNCRLKDLIEPLLVAAEKEITGLKLADFPRP